MLIEEEEADLKLLYSVGAVLGCAVVVVVIILICRANQAKTLE